MLSKNLLSIVALVFFGSQISSVIAEWANCSTNEEYAKIADFTGDCDVKAHCKLDDLIVGINDSTNPTCKKALDGVYVFNDNTGTIVNLANDISSATLSELFIYNCDGTTCAKTNGIFKDNDAYYTVDATTGAAEITATHKDNSNDCTTNPSDKIGMIAGDTLCLGESITPASADGNQYIMNNVADNAFTGGESDTDKQIVIKTGTQIFAYDNLIGDDEYCVTTATNLLTGRFANFCSNNDCNKYYECKDHICDLIDESHETCSAPAEECSLESESATNCVQGYYLKGTSSAKLAKENDEEGTLYYCESSTECEAVTAGDVKIGYYKNVDTVNTNVQYIKCETAESNVCKAVVVDKDDCNDVSNAGDLIVTAGPVYKICLGTNTEDAVSINTTSTAKSYLISVNTKNIFGNKASQYVKINTVDNKVTLADKG
ncbi:hypothetical protein H8356DRAFT_1081765 [Neocallimastix lanati (nom. inval.)]|nr:hypothetical protein H8356DRAFT_1081765 [Neocallimastix sp. JGI-2020a]